ncbi:hypothetical protein ACFSUJ_02165 [Streptomyces lusitanus]|uniref:Regulatory protein n=1 Tax=Streptomyces lusitanus TaxID=68232 RepID=A0ABU3JM64_9ACTN|nr:hypothetical protein [Streptomyces lusitanus]
MSDHSTVATDLTSQYVAQVANDLERNAKEQERVGAEIAELQGQLAALRRDHALLVKMRQALNLAAAPADSAADAAEDTAEDAGVAEAVAVGEPSAVTETSDETARPAEGTAASGRATVPAPRSRGGVTSGAQKPKRERKKVTAGGAAKSTGASKSGPAKAAGAKAGRKPAAPAPEGKASAAKTPRKAPAKAAQSAQTDAPKLVDLVRGHLGEQKEPRSAAEIAAALGQAHPGRTVKVTVIRSTLEGLVARNQAQRSKQGTSVFYTAPDGGTPAPERAADARS